MCETRIVRRIEPASCRTQPLAGYLRKFGWLALLGFTAKGLLTTSLIVWALIGAGD